jgi:hypothetical protein
VNIRTRQKEIVAEKLQKNRQEQTRTSLLHLTATSPIANKQLESDQVAASTSAKQVRMHDAEQQKQATWAARTSECRMQSRVAIEQTKIMSTEESKNLAKAAYSSKAIVIRKEWPTYRAKRKPPWLRTDPLASYYRGS